VLAHPVRRWEFIVGKYFGLAGTLVVNTVFMAIGFFLALRIVAHSFEASDGYLLVAMYFIILQFFIVTAIALLLSSFSTPVLSAVLSFSFFVIGCFATDLRMLAASATGLMHWVTTPIAYVVPNFASLNVISSVAHGNPVDHRLILLNTGYALFYCVAAISGAVVIFERRNLK
jgi:ABC-type transport system involved in multi-copper enzyme maturation permease subunit